tara:strand:- start:22417 stop:22707 length:291 start_codon:yes stop_codon:yes gene_type:complete
MDCKIKENDGKLVVTATIGPATKNTAPTSISTADVLKWLAQNHSKYKKLDLVQAGSAHNAALKEQRTGIWVFALTSKKSPTKPAITNPTKSKKIIS